MFENKYRETERRITNHIDYLQQGHEGGFEEMTRRETTTTKQYPRERGQQGLLVHRAVRALPTKATMKAKRYGKKSEREVRVSCIDSKSLQHIQHAHTIYQLV